MNLADASYRLGKELKRIEEGKEILEIYNLLRENSSASSWQIFSQSTLRGGLNSYTCLRYAHDLIKENINNEQLPDYLKKNIDEIVSNPNYKKLSDLSKVMHEGINILMKEVWENNLPTTFNGVKVKPKVRRALQDFGVMYQRTGIIKSLYNIASPIKSEFGKVSKDYDLKRNNFPFSNENLKSILELEKKGESKELLYFLESFNSYNQFIHQLIFETHMDLYTTIVNQQIMRINTKSFNKMILFHLKLNKPISQKVGCIIKLNVRDNVYYGIVNKTTTYFDKEEQIMKGFLYPLIDKGVFPESL